jgi:nucleoside-diphosphate-sugar epimerase
MTVMVLGANGFIGPHIVAALEEKTEIVAVSRRGTGPHGVAADRSDVRAIRKLVRERRATEVVDLLARTEADTLPLLETLDGEVGRYVLASSCDVYRNYEGLHGHASGPPIEGLLAEGSPLRTRLYPYRTDPPRDPAAADAWMDAYDKLPLEQALLERPGLGGTVMRLPMVFGPGDKQRRFRWCLAPMFADAEHIEADAGWLGFRSTFGYVADIGDALATAALRPAASGHVFNLGREGLGDNRAWLARFAAALGWRGEVRAAPSPPDGPLAGLDLSYPLTIDCRAFRNACAWTEPMSLDDALAATIADERGRG